MTRPIKSPRLPSPKVAEALALVGTPHDRRKASGPLPVHNALSASLAVGVDPQGVYRAIRKQKEIQS